MSDDVNAGGAAASEQQSNAGAADPGAAANAAAAPVAVQAGKSEGGVLDALKTDGAAAAPADWPEDWREKMTGGDETAMAIAKRYNSPQALWQKVLAQEQVIRRGTHKVAPELPDNPTEEQVAEYRKANGVPDTPEGYGLAFDPTLPVGETQQAMLQNIAKFAHDNHVPEKYAKTLFQGWQAQEVRAFQERQAEAQRQFAQTKEELRREYGHEYMRNIGVLERWLEANPGFNKLVIANMHDKQVLHDAIEAALAMADPGSLIASSSAMAGKTPDERIKELRRKSVDGTLSTAEDKEYNDLLAYRLKREEGRNRAA